IENGPRQSMENAGEALAGIKKLLAGEERTLSVEYPCHSPEQKRWFLMRGSSFDVEGERRVVLAHENVTARKQAEIRTARLNSRLEAKTRRFQKLFQFNQDGIIVADEYAVVVEVNPAALELFGKEREEMMGSQFGFPAADDHPVEVDIVDSSEVDRIAELRSTRIEWEGEPATLISIRDVTQRRNREKELDRLNSLLGTIRDVNQLIVDADSPGLLLEDACTILCRNDQYLYAWIIAFDEEGAPEYVGDSGVGEDLEEVLEKMTSGWEPVCVRRAMDDPGVPFVINPRRECNDCPLREKHADCLSLKCGLPESSKRNGLVTLRLRGEYQVDQREKDLIAELAGDIGVGLDRMQTEQELKESNRRLHKALEDLQEAQRQVIDQERRQALTQMASGIAHDFNNSLSTIRGFTDLLLQSEDNLTDPETVTRYLENVRKAASNAAETVSGMRKFYRPADEASMRAVNLNSIIEECIAMTRPRWKNQARAHGGEIEVQVERGDIPRVIGEETELHEMLTNLIFNAVDAMPEGGELTVRTRMEQGNVVLEVSDTGIGMSLEVRKRCMNPFFTTKKEGGTGLGLATVRGTAERHDAQITVESDEGEGTTFRISFPPAGEKEPEEKTGEQPSGTTQPLKSLNILVVEDEADQRKLLTRYLEMDDHKVKTAADGQKGLRAFRDADYDIVITDRSMPEMNGDELAATIQQEGNDQPIIMLTGFGDMMGTSGEKPAGVEEVLSKPVKQTDLQMTIARVIHQGKHRSEKQV
ncbi:MAG: ATP-binding protein, partial [Planctomycetota bacterium]